MKITIAENKAVISKKAAEEATRILKKSIKKNGSARLLLSTGISQIDFFKNMIKKNIDWSKVEVFHMEGFIGLSLNHKASSVSFLKHYFLDHVTVGKVNLISTNENINRTISILNKKIRKRPIDLGIVSVGISGHIAFNNPPANFVIKQPFIKVKVDDLTKRYFLRTQNFKSLDEIPEEAITITVHQILQTKNIISVIPDKIRAHAISKILRERVTNMVPGTALKKHKKWSLYLDHNSASEIIKCY
ncbi:MAG TPA: 6-phosphogluconolactonase [Victivallales bacterium]|nr:6-phosphogluconolactonase [Victivallales bacterium]